MTKKILIALGISMMSALPMTQASSVTTDKDFNHFIPMEVKIDKALTEMNNKDNKNNPPPMMKTDGKEDYNDKDEKNPPPKPPEKNGQAINGSDNPPPPPPSGKDGVNKPDFKSNEKLQTKVDDSSVKKVKEKSEKKKTKIRKI